MRVVILGLIAAVSLLVPEAIAQTALTGQVTSTEEGPMEGVLVSAKRDRLHHHHYGRERRAGPLRLPGRETGARPVRVARSRGRL